MDGQARINVILELKNKLKTGMSQAKQYINKNVSDIKNSISSLKNTHVEAFQKMKDEVPGLAKVMDFVKSPVVVLTSTVLLLAGAYSKASAMASEFQDKMLKANVTAQENSTDLKATSSDILGIASRSTTKNAVMAAPDAYNILLSSGMDKKTALATIEPTLQASKAGFTDLATVARAAAASMNSSGIKDAVQIYDILFATLNKGNAEFQDIANYLPKIIPVARNAGFTMQETAGAFAYLTAQGQTAERSSTLLENAFKVLADPDKVKKFNKIGISIYDSVGKMKPLTSIIDQLNVALNGLSDENRAKVLASLGLDMEAAGAFSAMSQDAKKFKEIIDFTVNSQGQLNAAISASKGPMDSWVKIGNKLDAMWVDVGGTVNETIGKIGDWLEPIASKALPVIGSVLKGICNTLSAILSVITNAVKAVIDWVASSELLKDSFSLIGTILQGLVTVIEWVADKISWLYNHTIKPIFDAVEWIYFQIKGGTSGQMGAALQNNKMGGSMDNTGVVGGGLQKTVGSGTPKNMYAQGEGGNDKVRSLLAGLSKKDKKESDKGITGGQQTRIITIHQMNAVNGDFVTQNPDFSKMSPKELERWLEELCQRMVMGLVRSANS